MSIRLGTYYPARNDSHGPTSGARALMDFVLKEYPGATNLGIYNPRDVAGSSVVSVHEEGRADDFGTPGDPQWGRDLANKLRSLSGELGIQGIIHDREAWWCNYGPEWHPYSGSDPHTGHVHAELTPYAAVTLTWATIAAAWHPVRRTLHQGDTGPDVTYLQSRLISHHEMVGYAPNGTFGPITDSAVRAFQRKAGLAVDGWVGPMTWAKL